MRFRCAPNVALLPTSELSTPETPTHLLRSPRYATRLLAALRRANLTNRKTAIRISPLVEAVLRDAFSGIGKPEALKYELAGA